LSRCDLFILSVRSQLLGIGIPFRGLKSDRPGPLLFFDAMK
jgi:hypothetical protein